MLFRSHHSYGIIKKIKDSTIVTFEADSEIINNIIVKGYVSIDGTSLTVNEIDGNLFKVSLIPHTIAETTSQKYHRCYK